MTTQGLPGDRNHHPLDCGGKCGMGHEQEPKYTESDMKVLTEAALRLGREEALDEAAGLIEEWKAQDDSTKEFRLGLGVAARIVRGIPSATVGVASQPSPDATSGRTDPEEGA